MYAIIESGGKQLKVEVGQEIFIEKLDVDAEDRYTFDKVLAISDSSLSVGSPYLKGASVVAKVLKQGKGKKIVIYKYKQKNGSSHRKQGHRQPYTKLVIEAINLSATKKAPAASEESAVSEEKVTKTAKPKAVAKPKKDDQS